MRHVEMKSVGVSIVGGRAMFKSMLAGALAALLIASSGAASAATMKECADKWNAMKESGRTIGLKYTDFSKACMKDEALPRASAEDEPAPKKKKTQVAKADQDDEGEADGSGQMKKACDAKWKLHKASTGAHGWKPYFTFMAKCM
jgi:hypothetical protein